MRPDRRMRRVAGIVGAIAVVIQAWLMLRFEAMMRWYWGLVEHLFGGYTVLSNRMSQLKPALFKAPLSWLYLALFVLLMLVAIVGLWSAGLRAASAPPDDEPPAT
jgi:hypothetical protein